MRALLKRRDLIVISCQAAAITTCAILVEQQAWTDRSVLEIALSTFSLTIVYVAIGVTVYGVVSRKGKSE